MSDGVEAALVMLDQADQSQAVRATLLTWRQTGATTPLPGGGPRRSRPISKSSRLSPSTTSSQPVGRSPSPASSMDLMLCEGCWHLFFQLPWICGAGRIESPQSLWAVAGPCTAKSLGSCLSLFDSSRLCPSSFLLEPRSQAQDILGGLPIGIRFGPSLLPECPPLRRWCRRHGAPPSFSLSSFVSRV